MTGKTPQRSTQDASQPRHRLRVLVVDDNAPFRAMLAALLRHVCGTEVVGEASNGAEAVQQAEAWRPDVILLDLAMPIMGGLEALPALRHFSPESRVVILSGLDAEGIGRIAVERGADAFLPKGRIDAATLERTLDEVVAAPPAASWAAAPLELLGEVVQPVPTDPGAHPTRGGEG